MSRKPKAPKLADVTFTDASGQVCKRFMPTKLRDGRYFICDVEAFFRVGFTECVLYYELGEMPDEKDVFPTIKLAWDYLRRTALTSKRYRLWSVEKKLDGGAT